MLEQWQQQEVLRQWREKTGTNELAKFCETDGEQFLSLRGVYSRAELREIVMLWEVADDE